MWGKYLEHIKNQHNNLFIFSFFQDLLFFLLLSTQVYNRKYTEVVITKTTAPCLIAKPTKIDGKIQMSKEQQKKSINHNLILILIRLPVFSRSATLLYIKVWDKNIQRVRIDHHTVFNSLFLLVYPLQITLMLMVFPTSTNRIYNEKKSTLKRLKGICFCIRKLRTLSWSTRSKCISFPICSLRSSSRAT